jgi:microcystin degradation protein MlrC
MRVFSASLATEINTFSPIPTDLSSFKEDFYYPPGTHPAAPHLFSAPLVVARRRADADRFTLIEGTCTSTQPAGMVSRDAYETLRDEILGQLRAALPVDAVISRPARCDGRARLRRLRRRPPGKRAGDSRARNRHRRRA